MARAPAGRGGHAQHAARVVGQCLQPQVEDVAQIRRQRPGGGVGRREQLLGEEGVALAARVQPRDESGAAASPRMPATCSASSACEKAPTSRRSTTARRSSSARNGRSGCWRCSSSLRYVQTRSRRSSRRPARARRGTRASSGRPSGCPRRRTGRATPRRAGRGALGRSPKRRAWPMASPVALMPSPGSSAARVALSSGSSRARSPPAGPTSSAKTSGSSSRASPRRAAAIGA